MPLPISVPLALSAIKALLRFRHRVDTILALNEAATGLPFRLPPGPVDDRAHIRDMLAFFEDTESGKIALALNDLQDAFNRVKSAIADGTRPSQADLANCLQLYFEAADVRPKLMAPGADDAALRQRASSGPSREMRLAYYVVESHRLSRNPALTRVLLATTDTLLEVVGENASSFISNPKVRGIVEVLLDEFAVKHDFDDDGAEDLFRRFLGAAAVAALENRDVLPNTPALKALFGALNDVREDLGDEFVARLVSSDGFENLVSRVLINVAEDPSFITSDELAKKVLTATLNELGQKFPEILRGDPQAVFGVLEAGLAVGAAHVESILKTELGDRPLISAVLSTMASSVAENARNNALFEKLATKEIFADLYKVALTAIAANPSALASETGMDDFVAKLIAGFADTLSTTDLDATMSHDTLRKIVSNSLLIAAEYPDLIARDDQFAAKVIKAVFEAAAPAVRDGLQAEDLIIVVDAAIGTANDNLALIEMGDRFRVVLGAIGGALAQQGIQPLLVADGRRDVLLAALGAISANPAVWGEFAARDVVQPLVTGVVNGLASDPTHLLSGTVMVDSVRRSLIALARRGKVVTDDGIGPEELQGLITLSLQAADARIGRSIDGEVLPEFLERVLLGFLEAPFPLAGIDDDTFKSLVEEAIAGTEGR